MRRAVLIFLFTLLGLYGVLHLVLGSSPVQKRVVAELQALLQEYGLNLEMESIEVSAFSPKVYLNRVRLSPTPKAKIDLKEPLSFDKIKVQFRPIALLFGRIVIDELMLYHPRIQIPRADKLYKTAMALFGSKNAIKVKRPDYDVIFYKLGVVDALFNIASMDPPFSVQSRSLTVIVDKRSGQQRSVVVQSDNLELGWEKYAVALTKVDVDADLGTDSLRLNRGIIENSDFAVNIVGASRMPSGTDSLPSNLSASYEIKTKLGFLNTLPGFKKPVLAGSAVSSGTIRKDGELFGGKGQVSYEGVTVDGYEVGSGSLAFALDKRRVDLSQVALKYAGGEFKSNRLQIELSEHYPVQGDLSYQGLLLEGVLKAVRVDDPPVTMETSGSIKVSGTLVEPFELKAQMDARMSNLVVPEEATQPKGPNNRLIQFGDGTLKGLLTFTLDKMDFDAEVGVLGGSVVGKGFVGFDDTAKVQASAKGASLTQMARIGSLELAGNADLSADVVVGKEGGYVTGKLDIQDARVAGIELGAVAGDAFYQADLLTFENLLLPSLEPIRGNGYVDFRGKGTQYKFYVNARRTETNQVFDILRNLKMNFEIPKGGEVNTRVTVEGTEKAADVQVTASGQMKNFKWFDERWLSGVFTLGYRDGSLDLSKALLTKPSGALEVRGKFGRGDMRLQLSSFGLEISGFDRFGNAPLTGEISGQLQFEGPKDKLFHGGRGELKIVKSKFRGVAIPDSTVKLRPDGDRLEYLFNLGGDRLRGRYVRSANAKKDELLVYFQDYDFAPLMTLVMSRDIPPMADLKATGDLSLIGDFDDLASLKGSGTVTQLLVGFKGTPMKISQPAQIKMDPSGMRVDSLFLQGEDSQLSMALNFEPGKRLDARLDGRIDLQYLQPFIPGLEYGNGKVSAGLRMSGLPAKYQLLGNVNLENGTFRLSGFQDEFRSVDTRLSVSQDRINVDKFEANVNGGMVTVDGDAKIDRFRTLQPNLRIRADKVVMRIQDYLSGKFSGEFGLRGKGRPYQIDGRCELLEGALTKFQVANTPAVAGATPSDPLFNFDIQCQGSEKLLVATDIMQAEFRGGFHLVGNNQRLGLLGTAEGIRGTLLFRDTKFNMDAASVKFDSPTDIVPRFRVSGRANVREVRTSTSEQLQGVQEVQNYEINLQVSGVPSDYKIRLTSTPSLLEGEIISLLVLGVTSGGRQSGNYMDLGSAMLGQIPLQSKLKNELGVNIKISSQPQSSLQQGSNLSPGTANSDITAPTVQIQKEITDKTKLSYSNTLETVPLREFRIEQMLDENITVNATTMERTRGTQTAPTQAYGVDFRYRFQFE